MITFSRNAFLILMCISLFACTSYKKFNYFNDVDRVGTSKEAITNYSPLTIQTQDLLSISISSLNPESSAIFNFASNTGAGNSESSNGYLVDEKGNIQLPVLGTVHVANLSSSQVRDQISLRLTPYLKEPVVLVKLLNFKVSVMGDVANPGLFNVPSERVTIPEAISLAGDLNITAVRSLLIVREINGEREFINVDISKKSLFNSPYYYLKSNDLIYVQGSKAKYSAMNPFYQRVSLVLSVLSVAAIFIFR